MTRALTTLVLGLLLLVAMVAPAAGKGPRKGKPAKAAPVAAPSEEASPTPAVRAPAAPSTGSATARSKGRAATPAAAPGAARQVVQRESHIEFDERLVQGQTAAGAIYLFQRGDSEFRSMVRLPESFRDRTVRPVLPPSPGAPINAAQTPQR